MISVISETQTSVRAYLGVESTYPWVIITKAVMFLAHLRGTDTLRWPL